MKIYPNLVDAAAQALHAIFVEEQLADIVVDTLLKTNPKWGSRDRRWVSERVYVGTRFVRRWLALLDIDTEDYTTLNLRVWRDVVGVVEMITQDVHEPVELWAHINVAACWKKLEQLKSQRAIYQSIPSWIDALMVEQLGEARWDALAAKLNEPTSVVVRVNTLIATEKQVLGKFVNANIEAESLGGGAILVKGRHQLTRLPIFRGGWFEIQDFASQQIVPFMGIDTNQIVLDMCAGAGGKTLQIGAMLRNTGRIVACDVEAHKLAELEQRATRAGITNLSKQLITDKMNWASFARCADRVLMDAPCSGTGVWRRQVDSRYKLTPAFLQTILQTQQAILEQYTNFAKPNAIVVYATCSVLPAENERQVAAFLASEAGQKFQLVEEKTLYPDEFGYDGFYMAKLKRLS